MVHRSWSKTSQLSDMRVSHRGIHCRTHRYVRMGRGIHLSEVGFPYQGRYARTSGPVPPLERVFRRVLYSAVYARRIAIHIADKYALSFRRFQQIGRYHRSRERVVERVFGLRLEAKRPAPIQQVFSLVNRLTEQYRRIDDVSRQASAPAKTDAPDRDNERSPTEPAQRLWPRAVEMILKRDAAAVQAVRQDAVQAAGPDNSRRLVEKESRSAQPPRSFSLAEFSPNELQRLTDQVVTKLDHRVIAMRERLGRA